MYTSAQNVYPGITVPTTQLSVRRQRSVRKRHRKDKAKAEAAAEAGARAGDTDRLRSRLPTESRRSQRPGLPQA